MCFYIFNERFCCLIKFLFQFRLYLLFRHITLINTYFILYSTNRSVFFLLWFQNVFLNYFHMPNRSSCFATIKDFTLQIHEYQWTRIRSNYKPLTWHRPGNWTNQSIHTNFIYSLCTVWINTNISICTSQKMLTIRWKSTALYFSIVSIFK